MSEFDEISPEEKLQIAQYFLLSSPPCQFGEVLSDTRKLISNDILSEPVANGIARVYNTRYSTVVTAPSGAKVNLNSVSEIDATHYVDPSNSTVFQINHLTLETKESIESVPQNDNLELKRAKLQIEINKYVNTKYISESSAGSVFVKDNKIFIVLTGEKENLRNYWSGRWNSTWTIQINESNSCIISGDIKLHAHYFEDGNVQLLSTKNIPVQNLSYNTDDDLSQSIVSTINTSEATVQKGLEDMYANMNEETFRAMRRLMPITRTKMEWNVNAVRLNKNLRK